MWSAPAYLLRVEQRWSMFSPQPPSRTRYYGRARRNRHGSCDRPPEQSRARTDRAAAGWALRPSALAQLLRLRDLKWNTRVPRASRCLSWGRLELVPCRPGTTDERASVLRQRGALGGRNRSACGSRSASPGTSPGTGPGCAMRGPAVPLERWFLRLAIGTRWAAALLGSRHRDRPDPAAPLPSPATPGRRVPARAAPGMVVHA